MFDLVEKINFLIELISNRSMNILPAAATASLVALTNMCMKMKKNKSKKMVNGNKSNYQNNKENIHCSKLYVSFNREPQDLMLLGSVKTFPVMHRIL